MPSPLSYALCLSSLALIAACTVAPEDDVDSVSADLVAVDPTTEHPWSGAGGGWHHGNRTPARAPITAPHYTSELHFYPTKYDPFVVNKTGNWLAGDRDSNGRPVLKYGSITSEENITSGRVDHLSLRGTDFYGDTKAGVRRLHPPTWTASFENVSLFDQPYDALDAQVISEIGPTALLYAIGGNHAAGYTARVVDPTTKATRWSAPCSPAAYQVLSDGALLCQDLADSIYRIRGVATGAVVTTLPAGTSFTSTMADNAGGFYGTSATSVVHVARSGATSTLASTLPGSEAPRLLATFGGGGALIAFRRVEAGYYVHYAAKLDAHEHALWTFRAMTGGYGAVKALTHPSGVVTLVVSGSSGKMISLAPDGTSRWELSIGSTCNVLAPLGDDLLYCDQAYRL